jgi:energy-coupling factor transporter ATP-binding protein EcfA2
VIDDLELTLEPGTLTWIGGSNGVGKTTMLRVLAGLIGPTDPGGRWLGEGFGLALRGSYPVHGLATRDASSQAIPIGLLLDDARAPSCWR